MNHECSAPDSRLSPPSSVKGGRGRSFFFLRRGDTFVTPLLVGRRDSPSATLRTRHVSLFAPSPSKPLKRIPGRRTVPPFGRDVRSGAPEKTRSKDETCDQQGGVPDGEWMKRSDFHVGGSYRRSASFPAPAVSSPTRRRLAAWLDRKDPTVAKGLPGPDDPPCLMVAMAFPLAASMGRHGTKTSTRRPICRRYLTGGALPIGCAFRTLRKGIGALSPGRESALLRLYHHPILHREQKGLLLPDRILLTGQAPIA